MVRGQKKIVKFLLLAFVAAAVLQTAVSAEGPYYNYINDSQTGYKTPIPCPAGYLPDRVINGVTLGIGNFKSPEDMYYNSTEKLLYVMDSGNSRIVVLDPDYSVSRVIYPEDKNNNRILFKDAKGIFVTEDSIYIPDEGAKTVYIFDKQGAYRSQLDCPKSDIIPADCSYKPSKVVVNSNGLIFVISDGCYYGAFQFSKSHQFLGFFGAESVTTDITSILNSVYSTILTKKQKKYQSLRIPTNYNNLDIDSQDFIYTCNNTEDAGQIRKLNYLGQNVLFYLTTGNKQTFGDLRQYNDPQNGIQKTMIADVNISSDGFINLLDSRRGRVFQYDQGSNLLFAFGGEGQQEGCFKEPVAISSIGTNILVLDKSNCNLTVFKTTDFANNVHKADILYNDGRFQEAFGYWNYVLKYDQNYPLANIGVGKAYQNLGQYAKSLSYFQYANDKIDYSDAFYNYRSLLMHEYFPVIALVILALIILPFVFGKVKSKNKTSEYDLIIGTIKYPFYTMIHPVKGFSSLKDDKKGSVLIANCILFVFFIISIISRQNTGFLFNNNKTETFNIFVTLIMTIGAFVMWVTANWAVSTLVDGEGKFKEIWVFSAYSLMPFVIFTALQVIFSNVLSLDEQFFYNFFEILIFGWTAVCLFAAITEVHQFTIKKTVWICILTILGIVFCIAIVAISYSMFAQLIQFIGMIYSELKMR